MGAFGVGFPLFLWAWFMEQSPTKASPISDCNVMRPPTAGLCLVAKTDYFVRVWAGDISVVKEGEVGSSGDSHLKALVVDHGPGAFVTKLVDSRVWVLQQNLHFANRSKGKVSGVTAVQAAAHAPLRLIKDPLSLHIFVGAVGRGVPKH